MILLLTKFCSNGTNTIYLPKNHGPIRRYHLRNGGQKTPIKDVKFYEKLIEENRSLI